MLLINFILFVLTYNEPVIKGRVLDSISNEAVPYSYIQFLDDDDSYITADANGNFQFIGTQRRSKGRMYVRSLGYEELYIEFDITKTQYIEIKLIPSPFELKNLTIQSNKTKKGLIGKPNSPTQNQLLYFPNPAVLFFTEKEKGQVTKMHFAISDQFGFPHAPLLIYFYSIHPTAKVESFMEVDLKYLRPLLSTPILFDEGKSGWNTIDLESYNIQFENEYVVVHLISSGDNSKYRWETQRKNKSGQIDTIGHFGPMLTDYRDFKSKKMIHLYSLEGKPDIFYVSGLFGKGNRLLTPAIALEYEIIN